ncbi:flagellar basal body L-ring protein FlgH [Pseudothermotoga thermarum]|uniref:Flagellar L-ring protein n=1 Tax=Pseudothermotoga thermarum DSM 5069 TaxID=688269 RepID=F7YVQ6_9THEM|nr:flagellar basal body L-ring protein FlgH [Pseudothermotoga thermarum]AEH51721.1 flagellar L-ring protein [Pseudothermotoga thermarum DSM 5069]
MRKILILTLTIFLIGVLNATSLWNSSNNSAFKNIFADKKARKIGDIVTIIVRETPTFNSASEYDSLAKALVNFITGAVKGITQFDLSQFIPINPNTMQKHSAKLSNNVSFTISATVVDVQDNKLVFEGSKKIKVQDQLSEIIIRGTARYEDIDANNTIEASKLADSQIWINGRLVFSQKPGQESWLDYVLTVLARFFL